MINNLAVVANPKAQNVKETLAILLECLGKYKINIMCDPYMQGMVSNSLICTHAEIAETADAIVVLGGDGTMLSAADIGYRREIPVLGIHMGRLGFITPFYQEEMSAVIARMFSGELTVQKRMRLQGRVMRNGEPVYQVSALNEITLMKGGLARLAYFEVLVGNTKIKDYRADGFIVGTATGSTGYNLSAGGPIVDPETEIFILTPICAHSMDSRGLLIGVDHTVCMRLVEEQRDIFISKDGIMGIELMYGDVIEIKKADFYTKLYYDPTRTFFDHLKVKFGWGN